MNTRTIISRTVFAAAMFAGFAATTLTADAGLYSSSYGRYGSSQSLGYSYTSRARSASRAYQGSYKPYASSRYSRPTNAYSRYSRTPLYYGSRSRSVGRSVGSRLSGYRR